MPPRQDTPDLPEALGPYRCLRKLAVGGMGEVYLAEAMGAGEFRKRLVIKAVRADRADDKETVQAFLDEARVWALLAHPNIVPLFDCVWLEGRLCLVMEYIEGADLRELLQGAQSQRRLIPLTIVVHLMAQVAAALQATHEARGPEGKLLGVVHRDVSPHNVLVDREGNARLCDFGIARSVLRHNRTRSGRFKGKFAYVAPEAIRGEAIDRRGDIFGMGVMLYELLTLERPFQADGPVPLLRAILEDDPPDLRRKRTGLSDALLAVVKTALEKKPAARFASAEEFRTALLETPEAEPRPSLSQLTGWFDDLTGIAEAEARTEPLLDLAARAAARAVDEDGDVEPVSDPSFEVIAEVPLEETGTTPLRRGIVPAPKTQSPPKSTPKQPVRSPSKDSSEQKDLGHGATIDLGEAKTLLKEGRRPVVVSPQTRWARRFRELWPWALGGAAGGATLALVWMMLTHRLGH